MVDSTEQPEITTQYSDDMLLVGSRNLTCAILQSSWPLNIRYSYAGLICSDLSLRWHGILALRLVSVMLQIQHRFQIFN